MGSAFYARVTARRIGVLLAIVIVVVIAATALLRTRSRPGLHDEALLGRLESLGYLERVTTDPDPARTDVSLHDPDRAHRGINVYCSVRSRDIRFVDMDGNVLHTITLPEAGDGSDCLLVPTGDGDYLALASPLLMRIGWNSEVRWISRRGHHHDIGLDDEGNIYTLSEKPGLLRRGGAPIPIRDHSILILDEHGNVVREIELSPLFGGAVAAKRIEWIRRLIRREEPEAWPYEVANDVYHPNGIRVLDREVGAGKPGHLLVCLRDLNLVAIVDPDREAVVWRWGTRELDLPHHPTVLGNGNILVFDNGFVRKWSRVIEIDPATGQIVWEYRGEPRESFFSDVRGSSQALPNGNVLITESTRGHVFEVTQTGEIVWEFWNPDRADDGVRRQIYRMQRFALEQLGLP